MNILSDSSLDSPDPAVERLNLLSRERLMQETAHLREEVIDRSYEAILLFAKRDQETDAKLHDEATQEGDELRFFIALDFLAAPVRGSYVWTWSIELAPDRELGQTGNERMYIYMPVSKEENDLSRYDIDDIPKPDRMYIKHIDSDGKLDSYELTRDNLFRYTTVADTGEEQVHEEDDIGEWLLDSLTRRVDSRLPVIAQLQEALINMKVIPQRIEKVPAPTSEAD